MPFIKLLIYVFSGEINLFSAIILSPCRIKGIYQTEKEKYRRKRQTHAAVVIYSHQRQQNLAGILNFCEGPYLGSLTHPPAFLLRISASTSGLPAQGYCFTFGAPCFGTLLHPRDTRFWIIASPSVHPAEDHC